MITPLTAEAQKLTLSTMDQLVQASLEWGIGIGKKIIVALIIFFVGRFLIRLINKFVSRVLSRGSVDPSVQSFLRSLVSILLTVLLIITVIGALGISTTSFAALLASAGVAVGMALSGNLQNFAGGLIILLFKPYRVGDWIEAQNYQGRVISIQIFHTIIETIDLRHVYVPNGSMSTSLVVNHSQNAVRREQWTVSVAYGSNLEHARDVIRQTLEAEPRLLREPKDTAGKALAPYFIEVGELSASSVDFTVRAYVNEPDYWPVHHRMMEAFYNAITADAELDIPFTTQTLHIVKEKEVDTH